MDCSLRFVAKNRRPLTFQDGKIVQNILCCRLIGFQNLLSCGVDCLLAFRVINLLTDF